MKKLLESFDPRRLDSEELAVVGVALGVALGCALAGWWTWAGATLAAAPLVIFEQRHKG